MMQIDDILADLKKRKANLAALKKEIAADKTKAAIAVTVDALISKLGPIVTERDRLEKLKPQVTKFTTDVAAYNGKQNLLINAFNDLKKAANSVEGDTKNKDFEAIYKDADNYAQLNNMETK